jgi:uncharacterized repeat protein (TIGR01451 family)
MFKKLLSNLPFNPSLIGQVSFYAQRLRRESAVRRIGVVTLILAMFIQVFAVVSPPEPTLARSGNDIIDGGFTTREQAVQNCRGGIYSEFWHILNYYEVSCDTLAAAEIVSLRSTDYEGKLDSLGRWQQGPTIAGTGKPTNEYAVDINGARYYMRNLWAWDSGASSTYKMLRMKNTRGLIIMVMFDCGNIVTIDRYSPPAPAPAPTKPNPQIISKTTLPGMPAAESFVRAGDNIGYRIYFKNAGNAAATNVFIEDSTPRHTSFVSQGTGGASRYGYSDTVYPGHGQEPHVHWVYNTMPANANGYYVDFTVKVNTGTTNGQRICNKAFIRSNETPQACSNEVCHTVKINAPQPPATPPVAPITPTTPTPPSLTLGKKARNVSQNIADANNTTARAGDTIQYVLSVKNKGETTMKDFVIEESMGDVLEYADITDLAGGAIDDKKIVRWKPTDIKAGETIQRNLLITIKAQIPSTPVSSSYPGSFDLIMTNVYGDTVNIKLPPTVIKTAEQTVKALPNTGPGESLAAIMLLVIVASYFFARNKLIVKELDMVRTEFTSSGGY